ncbi:MAG TPA: transglutaminase domain-containing protein [Pyrinomonadaceae bacterium]
MSHIKKYAGQNVCPEPPNVLDRSPFLRRFLCVILLCFLAVLTGRAQPASVSDRAAEWNKYQTPASAFVRVKDVANGVVFRAPADWARVETAPAAEARPVFRFNGPHASMLQVSIEKIPDGLPLTSYVAAILQQLRNVPGATAPLAVRRTEMSGLEAREIMFEVPDENGELSRRVIWCTATGPVAVAVLLIGPGQSSAEIEPYLRTVIRSVAIPGKEKLEVFELLRANAIKDTKPARVDQLQALVGTIDGLNADERETAVTNLTQLFIASPDVGIDLLLDRRPIVRAAAIDALARSKNRLLDPFLLKALNDSEAIVAERAGRALAAAPNALTLLRDETVSWMNTALLARAWPFVEKQTKLHILNEVFGRQTRPGPRPTKSRATLRLAGDYAQDSRTRLGLLTLLIDVPVQDFRLPLAAVLTARYDVLTAVALHVAIARDEKLDAHELLKLLSAGSTEVRRLAAVNLGDSATMAHVPQIEAAQKKIATPDSGTILADSNVAAKNSAVASELQATIKKIRLREQLSALSDEQRTAAIKVALADPQLANWAWFRYANQATAASAGTDSSKAPQLSLREENTFPDKLTHYVSVQKPGDLLNKLGESLNSIKMDSARSQANLVLVINALHRLLATEFGAPVDGTITEYAGLNTIAPISLGSWNLAGVPLSIPSAQRKAVLVRVRDRDRFERSLTLYQDAFGSFASLPEGLAIGARFLGALPAILPMSADQLLQDRPRKEKNIPILEYTLSGQTEVAGYPVKYLAQRYVLENGEFTDNGVYAIYAGNVALLAPDLASLRDVLRRVNTGGPTIEKNPQYTAALAGGGDAIYFSNLTELVVEAGVTSESQTREHGALRISNSSWESSYYLTSDDKSDAKLLLGLSPDQLAGPRELLPRSTLFYYFMKISPPDALRAWNKMTDSKRDPAGIWSLNFEKEVLPEIEGECGAAVLGWPDLMADEGSAPWIVFFKLKSDRLQQALNEGRLFKETTASKGVSKIKFGTTELNIIITNGFLVFADSPGTLDQLKQPEKLATSPDFTKAVKRTPTDVVAFGGYNLDVTIPSTTGGSDSVQTQQANMILLLARAFHSPSFYAKVNAGNIEAHSSVSLDREGRYSVAELQALAAKSEPAYAAIQPGGIPISNQKRLRHLTLRIQVKAAGGAERIAEDVVNNSQMIERRAGEELVLKVLPRSADTTQRIQLPITASEFATYLKPTADIRADDQTIIDKAKEIAGSDRDAWSVARKLSDWTHANITWKVVDAANAAQTLATREADCYEFSKLYVAMARSLGLPARIVSGLAYSGSSFGGHAWVEVYIGRWIELDPTWGTNFVDATHIKTSNGALVSYAALDLIKVDVLDARRGAAEYQADPQTLAKKLCEELPDGTSEALESALDVALVTDDLMGPGTWATLTESERDQISGPFRRVVSGFASNFRKSQPFGVGLRLLKVNRDGNRAEALVMHSANFQESLLKFLMVRQEDGWMLREILDVDTGLRTIAENLEPAIYELRGRRSGQQQRAMFQTDFARVMVLIEQNAQASLDLADRLLKQKPKDAPLRYLKSVALAALEKDEEAAKIWIELSEEDPPFAQALRKLAEHYEASETESDRKKAGDLYQRYIVFEPDDPRARTSLGNLHELAGDLARAESEYRAAVERDSSNSIVFLDLAEFYTTRRRFSEAVAVIDEAGKRTGDKEDLFAELLSRYWFTQEADVPEALAASQPQRMAQSARANVSLARIRLNHERTREAIPLLKKAAALNPKSSEAYEMLAEAYRGMRDWASALAAADTAIRIDPEDAYGHYERACALARLWRARGALAALKRAVELDEDLKEALAEEDDLKSLSRLPEFKKLLPPPAPPESPTVKKP